MRTITRTELVKKEALGNWGLPIFLLEDIIMYGILRDSTNTGNDGELLIPFSTPLNVYSNQPAFVSDSLSLKRYAGSRNAQRWEIEASLSPTGIEENAANALVHTVVNGFVNIFPIRMPQVIRPEHQMVPEARSLSVETSVLKGGSVIDIDGLFFDEIYPGEFIQFGNHTKVYMVQTGGNGAGVRIHPQLRSDVPAGTPIKFGKKVTMLGRYDTDVQLGIKYRDGIMSDPGIVRIVEAL